MIIFVYSNTCPHCINAKRILMEKKVQAKWYEPDEFERVSGINVEFVPAFFNFHDKTFTPLSFDEVLQNTTLGLNREESWCMVL